MERWNLSTRVVSLIYNINCGCYLGLFIIRYVVLDYAEHMILVRFFLECKLVDL
jgi:hypothetical protein